MAGPKELREEVGAGQFFTLAFGCIIGVAWVVVLGEWLSLAGPIGAILGFLVGGAVMMLIGLCYAELLRKRRPDMHRPYKIPGGRATALAATVVSLLLFLFSFYEQYLRSEGPVPLEWTLFFGWGALGGLFWIGARSVRKSVTEAERRHLILGGQEGAPGQR